jgi:hypothetical protein
MIRIDGLIILIPLSAPPWLLGDPLASCRIM